MKIALLSTPNSEILGHIINKFIEYDLDIDSIIFDSVIPDERRLQRWNERTNGKIPFIPMGKFENSFIPCFYFENHSSLITESFVKNNEIDILINAGTPRILKANLLNAPSLGIINCHPGILPYFRGCTCVEWAIYHDKPVGNTVHIMTEEIDEGPVLAKETINFLKSDNYSDIRVKVYMNGFDLLARSIKRYINKPYLDNFYKKNGDYYKVIDDVKMGKVLEKINFGKYKFQLDQ